MSLRTFGARFVIVAAACGLALSGTACTATRTQGYDLPEDGLRQVRVGQSQDLVRVVLGSPQTTNTFGTETAWYYVETKVQQTAFGLNMVEDRTVLAVYFDSKKRVSNKVVYGLEDGRVIDVETRRTPSFGQDRTFVESIISSF